MLPLFHIRSITHAIPAARRLHIRAASNAGRTDKEYLANHQLDTIAFTAVSETAALAVIPTAPARRAYRQSGCATAW